MAVQQTLLSLNIIQKNPPEASQTINEITFPFDYCDFVATFIYLEEQVVTFSDTQRPANFFRDGKLSLAGDSGL